MEKYTMSKDYNTQILFQDEFSLIDIYEVIFHMEKGKGLEQLNNFKKKKEQERSYTISFQDLL